MRRVVLLCAAGMSTSLLVTKIQAEAQRQNYELSIEAFPVAKYAEATQDADVVLLGPQIRYELNRIKAAVSVPVEAIDMTAYGMMDGPKVIAQIKALLHD